MLVTGCRFRATPRFSSTINRTRILETASLLLSGIGANRASSKLLEQCSYLGLARHVTEQITFAEQGQRGAKASWIWCSGWSYYANHCRRQRCWCDRRWLSRWKRFDIRDGRGALRARGRLPIPEPSYVLLLACAAMR